ncbi:hypothetical protein PABG_04653 [Paracoccidioides brasiliensis Pb03]|nr:hypothetical protein PABG_04653 [Paracoccidioides brasiliensis Pb03]
MQALPDKLLHITGRRVREVGPGRGVSRAWLALSSCITRVASSKGAKIVHDSRHPTADSHLVCARICVISAAQGREKERKDCHTPDIVVIDAHRRLDFNVIFNFTLESSHHH